MVHVKQNLSNVSVGEGMDVLAFTDTHSSICCLSCILSSIQLSPQACKLLFSSHVVWVSLGSDCGLFTYDVAVVGAVPMMMMVGFVPWEESVLDGSEVK
jgi:hypothetical protein